MAHGIKQVISFFPPNMKGKDDENDGAAVIKEENTWNIYFHNLNRTILLYNKLFLKL